MKEPDPLRAFVAPEHEPQLDSEYSASLPELLYSAPDWEGEEFAVELAHLFRNHVALRSAFRVVLQMRAYAEANLKTLDEPRDVFRLQGEIRAFDAYINNILTYMEEGETPKETPQ